MGDKVGFFRRVVDWTVPPPLDRQLATLTIRNTKNDPDSCNVLLNANFGTSRLQLEIDDTTLEIDCSIKQAEVRLYSGNARLDFGLDYPRFKSQPTAELDTVSARETNRLLDGEAHVGFGLAGPTAGAKAKVKGKLAQNDVDTLSHSKRKFSFNHIDFHTVSITGLPGQTYLEGSEVVEYEGWKGTYDDTEKKVGIAAAIIVREQWIDFSNPEVKGEGKIRKALSSIFRSETSKKAQQFRVLLAYLVRKSLQDPAEKKYATIACHAFVLDPNTEQSAVLQRPNELKNLTIHPALVDQFSCLPPGTHEEFVKSVIAADAPLNQKFLAKGFEDQGRFSAPMASVNDVLATLELYQVKRSSGSNNNTTSEFIASIPRNVRRDLTALGFLTASSGRSVDTLSYFQGTPESALLFAASKTDWFNFTADVLSKNGLRFSAYRVGAEVNEEFGLGWGESSQVRYGHNMKRWVAMLHPEFADLDKNHVDYWYVRALKSPAKNKGSIAIIDLELATEIEHRRLKGMSYKSITESVGISTGSYSKWKSKNQALYEQAVDQALKILNALED